MSTTTRKTVCADCKHEARERQLRACVHETSRGWIVARWDERHAQYQAARYVRATSTDAHTAVARTVEVLSADGSVKKYTTRASAARALDAPSSEYWPRCTHERTGAAQRVRGNGA